MQGKGFTQSGINQLKQAGIVQNKQQANQMLKDFQTANAGQNVTQQQFQDFVRTYKPPAQTFTMPSGLPAGIDPNQPMATMQYVSPDKNPMATANVTQQQFQDYAKAYQAPAPKVVSNNPANIKTRK